MTEIRMRRRFRFGCVRQNDMYMYIERHLKIFHFSQIQNGRTLFLVKNAKKVTTSVKIINGRHLWEIPRSFYRIKISKLWQFTSNKYLYLGNYPQCDSVYPSKHQRLNQCLCYVDSASQTVASIITTLVQRFVVTGVEVQRGPVNTKHSYNINTLVVQSRRLRPTLYKCYTNVVRLLWPSKHEALNQCWGNVGPPSTTSSQHWPNIDSMPRVCWGVTDHAALGASLHHKTYTDTVIWKIAANLS